MADTLLRDTGCSFIDTCSEEFFFRCQAHITLCVSVTLSRFLIRRPPAMLAAALPAARYCRHREDIAKRRILPPLTPPRALHALPFSPRSPPIFSAYRHDMLPERYALMSYAPLMLPPVSADAPPMLSHTISAATAGYDLRCLPATITP
jgi:hypothetical protein